ncbi:MAG: carboxypeptidase regulatory-like domain-containing protein [Ferruginibacter sp.]|nr:carboxypeptidase regulatory-like domain-containing protein [Chitinophagaceae bacterium]
MKKIILILGIAFGAIAFVSPHSLKSGIYGTIEPSEGAKKVWAVSGMDSVSAIPVTGKFSLEVKPGNWALIVEAVKPYKNAIVDNVLVLDGQSTDAGVIRLPE